MKTLVLFVCLCSLSLRAQIIMEQSYDGVSNVNGFGMINLTTSGYKYYARDTSQITIYNLNHSVFRSFTIPTLPTTDTYVGCMYVTEELFNTNPNDIEYLILYRDTIGPGPLGDQHLIVFDEFGNTLFSRDSATTAAHVFSAGAPNIGIYYTSSGVKMSLLLPGNRYEVYSLPGILPCNDCTGGVISGLSPSAFTYESPQVGNPYPNPTGTELVLPYALPQGNSRGELVVYDAMGAEVKRFEVTNAFSNLLLDVQEFAAGTYYYSIYSNNEIIPGKKFIVQ